MEAPNELYAPVFTGIVNTIGAVNVSLRKLVEEPDPNNGGFPSPPIPPPVATPEMIARFVKLTRSTNFSVIFLVFGLNHESWHFATKLKIILAVLGLSNRRVEMVKDVFPLVREVILTTPVSNKASGEGMTKAHGLMNEFAQGGYLKAYNSDSKDRYPYEVCDKLIHEVALAFSHINDTTVSVFINKAFRSDISEPAESEMRALEERFDRLPYKVDYEAIIHLVKPRTLQDLIAWTLHALALDDEGVGEQEHGKASSISEMLVKINNVVFIRTQADQEHEKSTTKLTKNHLLAATEGCSMFEYVEDGSLINPMFQLSENGRVLLLEHYKSVPIAEENKAIRASEGGYTYIDEPYFLNI